MTIRETAIAKLQYLVRQYSIALTPGLQLLSSQPLKQQRLTAPIAGLTQPRSSFAALPNAQTELQQVKSEIANGGVLLNEQFRGRLRSSRLYSK